jgi:hypothetical protein
MTETEPAAEAAEPEDTPIEELASRSETDIGVLLELARQLVRARMQRKQAEVAEEAVAEALLPMMRGKELHGIRLTDGTAVRRRWSPNRPTIDPVKLAAKCADAPDFIGVKVTVDQQALKEAYPGLWREFGGKERETIVIAEPKKGKA